MTRRYLLPAILFISLIFSGCGGGGGSAGSQGPSGAGSPEGTLDSGGGPTGRIELAIQWPQVSKVGKLIPQAADRVEVSVSGEGLSQSLFQSVPRSQMQNNQAIVSFPSVPVGNKVVEVKALDSANNIVAHRIKPISVTSGQQSQVEAPLGMTAFDGGFVPSQFSLSRGETIMIINGGQLNHSIVKGSDGSAISGVLAPGGSYTFQANSPGTYNFRCGIHPTETGVLFGSFPPPTISSISPLTGTAGSTLTINGTNFGAVQMGGTGVTIGNVNAQATVWSDTQIQCTVPFGTGATNGNVTVTVAGNPVTFSSPFAAKPVEDWTRTENNNAINDSDSANAIALDGSGNIYVAGSISNASGNPDIWVRKYDPSGNISWTKNQAGGANLDDEARAIAVDGSGNAYVVGVEYQTGSPQKEIWVRKYSSTGGVLWTDSYGGILNADDYGNGVAVDSAGNFYVAGGKSSGQGLNFSVRKYDFTGTVVWDQEYNGPDNIDDEATCVAVDGSQNVYVAGYETTSPSNWNDILVRKYDSSGTLLWTRTNSNMGEDRAKAIRVDASGNVYVAGYVTGSPTNVWVRKYDTNGNTLWTQTYDSPANSYDYGYGIAVDVFGNVYVTGDEERSDLGQGPNVWIRKFSPTGTPIWTETYNGGANMGDVGKAITVDANGNVFIAGQTLESLAQLSDIWVRKYKQ